MLEHEIEECRKWVRESAEIAMVRVEKSFDLWPGQPSLLGVSLAAYVAADGIPGATAPRVSIAMTRQEVAKGNRLDVLKTRWQSALASLWSVAVKAISDRNLELLEAAA